MNIELEWLFLACFRLWQDGRPYLVTDQGTPSVLGIGRDEPTFDGELMIASSLIGKPIVAVEAAEAPDHPEGADPNALYAFEAGGLWFLHMGDLGFGLDAEALEPFKDKCDVLLAITGSAAAAQGRPANHRRTRTVGVRGDEFYDLRVSPEGRARRVE